MTLAVPPGDPLGPHLFFTPVREQVMNDGLLLSAPLTAASELRSLRNNRKD